MVCYFEDTSLGARVSRQNLLQEVDERSQDYKTPTETPTGKVRSTQVEERVLQVAFHCQVRLCIEGAVCILYCIVLN